MSILEAAPFPLLPQGYNTTSSGPEGMTTTGCKVSATVEELQADPTSLKIPSSLSPPANDYVEAFRALQFCTYPLTEERDNGQVHFRVPFHFASKVRGASSSQHSPARAHRLAQEMASFPLSLPLAPSSSIFVCCDKSRFDVIKVLITGPSDTPYSNGCFEFDVFFPLDYPTTPMLVNLMTTGQGTVRFNPNLYNDGKVCLSVLNTWHGSPEEMWNPQTSTLLQVLVSIQSLVLVPEPYFNEPGYEQQRGLPSGYQSSLFYNWNIYISTIQWAMLNQIRSPSSCFKQIILKHFYLRQEEVLLECERWKRNMVDGIQKLKDMGKPVANATEIFKNLESSVEILRTELNKIKSSDFQTIEEE